MRKTIFLLIFLSILFLHIFLLIFPKRLEFEEIRCPRDVESEFWKNPTNFCKVETEENYIFLAVNLNCCTNVKIFEKGDKIVVVETVDKGYVCKCFNIRCFKIKVSRKYDELIVKFWNNKTVETNLR